MILEPGGRFGRYVVRALLGHGGMGEVYRVYDPRLEREVALKLLRPPADADTDTVARARARLLREARAAAALTHPNAVVVFEVGEEGGAAYLAMELVAGHSLRDVVATRSAIPVARRIGWLVDVARALGAAHRRGLVHRDIKPENVMVSDDGVVKVLDFGIAQRAGAAWDAYAQTRASGEPAPLETLAGRIAGTPLYMAPEQMRGDEPDGRADQFSWAVMAYELVTGTLPWPYDKDLVAFLATLHSQPPGPIDELAPDVPDDVRRAILRALEREPERRFPSMEALLEALGAVVGPASSGVVAGSGRAQGTPARSDLATEVAPLPGAAAAIESVHTAPAVSSTPPTARPARRGTARAAMGAAAVIAAGILGFAIWRGTRPSSPPAPAASASASPASVGDMTRAPHATSGVPAADAAYAGALQAYRDSSYADALGALQNAVKLDPSMGCAWLRIAIWTGVGDPATARRAYAEARKSRASLVERDQALLEAIGPLFAKETFAFEVAAERLSALARSREDAEIDAYAAIYENMRANFDAQRELLTRALALDPKFSMARGLLAPVAGYEGQDWRPPIDQCLADTPTGTLCLDGQAWICAETGDCPCAERTARTWVQIAPQEARAFGILASAQLAVGRPIEAVRESLARKRSAEFRQDNVMLSPEAETMRLFDDFGLAALGGDLADAEAKLRELMKLVEHKPDEGAHAFAACSLVDLLVETGRPDEAATIAEDFLRRREGWTRDPIVDDTGLERDPRPRLAAALSRGGRISADELRAARGAWLAEWRALVSGGWKRWIWTYAYARPAETAEQAREAVAALGQFPPQPPRRPLTFGDADVGRVFLLAGRAAEALPLLERATRTCSALSYPLAHTRAHYFLGQAREATGDPRGACAAYAVVLSRWGAASGPSSVTADLARSRARELGCTEGVPPKARR